jgi:hypothetical protein
MFITLSKVEDSDICSYLNHGDVRSFVRRSASIQVVERSFLAFISLSIALNTVRTDTEFVSGQSLKM